MMKRHLVDMLVTILREERKEVVLSALVHNNLRMSPSQGFYLMLHYKLLNGTLM